MSSSNTIPNKPKIPRLLIFSLTFWGVGAFTYSNGTLIFVDAIINPWFFNNNTEIANFATLCIYLILIIISIILLFLYLRYANNMYFIATAFFLGILLATSGTIQLQKQQSDIYQLNMSEVICEADTDQNVGKYNNTCTAHVKNDKYQNWKFKLNIDKEFGEIHAGDILNGNINFYSISDSQKDNYWQNGICANAKITNLSKIKPDNLIGYIYEFRNQLISIIREKDISKYDSYSDSEQLLNAIVCGQRIDLSQGDLYNSFKNTGLAHLVAVSGAHLSLVSSLVLILLNMLKIKKRNIIIIQSIFIFLYLVCSAFPISAVRAAFMSYCSLLSFISKRRASSLNGLALCIIIFITLDAQTAVSMSFVLSAGSTLGIILFSNLINYYIKVLLKKCPEMICSSLSLTVAASICSQPISTSIFYQLPLIAPIANIVTAPIFTLVCGYGIFSCVLSVWLNNFAQPIASVIINIGYLFSNILCQTVKFFEKIPYSSIACTMNTYIAIIVSAIICSLLYITWPKKTAKSTLSGIYYPVNFHNNKPTSIYMPKRNSNHKKNKSIFIFIISACMIIMICIFLNQPGETTLTMLDVGQGDSIILKSKGKTFMIDTGNQDSQLKQKLAHFNIKHLDGLLITHPDDDHCGSLDVISQLVEVDNIYVANEIFSNSSTNCRKLISNCEKIVNYSSIVGLQTGDILNFEEISLKVVWPYKFSDNGGNSDSVCIMAYIDLNCDDTIEGSCFLCGDAEKAQLEELKKLGKLDKCDIYKVGHHGSKNAITEDTADTLNPKISLVSVGANNRYGHPSKNILDMLENNGSKIYRTDLQGDITCRFKSQNIEISTEK